MSQNLYVNLNNLTTSSAASSAAKSGQTLHLYTKEGTESYVQNALKNAAAYTAGDLYALLSLCRENAFLGRVWVLSENMDCTAAFKAAAHAFFTYRGDEALCAAFIDGFGKTDLDGQMAYFALHEGRVRSALLAAEQSLAQKGRLCVALGLFVGVSAALILL